MFDIDEINQVRVQLAHLDPGVDDARRIERLRALEELKSAVAAAQLHEASAFAASQRAEQQRLGIAADRASRGIASQVALALRTSPFQATRFVGRASILTRELPVTLAELAAGRTTEWRALLVARETAWLSREHRAAVDADLAPRLESLGDRRVEAEAKKLAYKLDPAGAMAKVRGATGDRRVTLRPAPETMARLTGLLPVAQGVAAYAALQRDAASLIASGDTRSRGQLMADLLVQRLTGQAAASDVPVEINLLVPAETLLGHTDEAAHLDGYGPIPADLARELAASDAPTWLRRVFTAPTTDELMTMESRSRAFTDNQRLFLRLRDQVCRTPWCEAPIRHTDHIVPAERDGPTSVSNGQGLCQACNHAKQAPGWGAGPTADGNVRITTPTGHSYDSRAPDPPGRSPELQAASAQPFAA